MFDSLAHYGLTQSILQILIIAGVILVVIGMFWHYILAGSLVLFAFVVFFYETPKTQSVDSVAVVRTVKPDTPAETEKQRWHRQFMEDCTTVADNSTETCDNIWNDRIMEESRLEIKPEVEVQDVKFKMNTKVKYD
jgi:hypothetical protein